MFPLLSEQGSGISTVHAARGTLAIRGGGFLAWSNASMQNESFRWVYPVRTGV